MYIYISGNKCSIIQAFVTKNWDSGSAYEFDECYSSFSDPKNIMEEHPATYFSFAGSSRQSSTRQKKNPGKGYYSDDFNYCFFTALTNSDDTAWWNVDLKEYARLQKIVVAVPKYTSYFSHVTFRFGNSSNYADNPELSYSSTPIGAFPLTVYVPHSNSGRFVSLESKIVKYFGIGTILIIRE